MNRLEWMALLVRRKAALDDADLSGVEKLGCVVAPTPALLEVSLWKASRIRAVPQPLVDGDPPRVERVVLGRSVSLAEIENEWARHRKPSLRS